MKVTSVLALGLLLTASGQFSARAQEGDERRHPKIEEEIYHHAEVKKLPPGRALADHRKRLFARGINGSDLNREKVVIYTLGRLPQAAVAAFAGRGIMIHPDLWVPPIPGRHPLGYHLGVVSYADLPALADDARVMRVESAENHSFPQNDLGGALIHVDMVHAGTGLNNPRDGTGVRIAIADSGVDLSHPDFSAPEEAFDVTDGEGVANWGTNVASPVDNHGTHVAGTVVGNGSLSNGRYVGMAPGATWAFYKIGGDISSSADEEDMIEAISRASFMNYDIFTMSFGGFNDRYMDGSGAMEQAIDVAVLSGVTVFISAGNSANESKHDSMNVAPSATSPVFGFALNNANGTAANTTPETIRVIWLDDQEGNSNITLTCSNLGAGETLTRISSGTSSRGTDARRYDLTPNIAAGAQKTYNLRLANSATTGSTPLVHCYSTSSNPATFTAADPAFTVSSPAIADLAIAVGAWVHRANWTDFNGIAFGRNFGQTAGTLADFSSLGPRIDQVQKPTLLAPGSATISLLDSNNANLTNSEPAWRIIDNDGLNLNGSGPANYVVSQGTSMATPLAAGVAALLLEENPGLSSFQVRDALLLTASSAHAPNSSQGYGLIDALAGVREADTPAVWVDFQFAGFEMGTFANPYNTVAEGAAAVPLLAPDNPFPPRLRIKAGTSSETPVLNKLMRVESFAGPASIGP